MISPRSLLEVSRELARLDKRRPRQASLRRAISTAYYALFHLLIQAAAEQLLGPGASRRTLRENASRWFTHQKMVETCAQFQASVAPKKLQGKLAPGVSVSPELQRVARSFTALQSARHAADYDPTRRYQRQMALALVERAEKAFVDWESAGTDPLRQVFLLLMLTGDTIIKDR